MNALITYYEKAINLCLKYSEQPERLRYWLENNSVKILGTVPVPSPFGNRTCLRRTVQVNTGQPFEFYGSISEYNAIQGRDPVARQKAFDGRLYSILCCIGCDLRTPNDFEEFCTVYGYDADSREAFKTFEKCLDQKRLLIESGLSVEDAEFMPH